MVRYPETRHPGADQLHDFLVGKVNGEQAEAIEAHLESCEACRKRLDESAPSDPFVQLVCRAEAARIGESIRRRSDGAESPPEDDPPSPRGAAVPPEVSIDGYEILEELGRGGMGVVYRARHLRLNRPVALKVILAGEHSSEADRQRFRREAETIARLRHPGIVQIYEIGEHAGRMYVALELVEGASLRQAIDARPRDSRWSADILMQLARTVHYAHQAGVIHRDLKPENVLLPRATGPSPPAGEPKITDFGLAKEMNSTSDLTKSGAVAGTLAYMAPEQAGGRPGDVSPAVDIHALGVIFYELLTGRPPFRSSDTLELLTMILSDDPLPPRSLQADVSRDLEAICLKCLAKRPSSRYETAEELAEDLQRFLHGAPVRARGLGPGERLLQWARRYPFLAVSYSCGLLFYGLHLICMEVLRLPAHQGAFHWILTGLLAAWCAAVTILQLWLKNPRANLPVRYFYATITALFLAAGMTADSGPRSAPIPLLLLLIPASLFLLPRPPMIWWTTGLALAAYAWLTAYAYWFRPQYVVPMEQTVAFGLCLLAMGLVMHLAIRHARWVN